MIAGARSQLPSPLAAYQDETMNSYIRRICGVARLPERRVLGLLGSSRTSFPSLPVVSDDFFKNLAILTHQSERVLRIRLSNWSPPAVPGAQRPHPRPFPNRYATSCRRCQIERDYAWISPAPAPPKFICPKHRTWLSYPELQTRPGALATLEVVRSARKFDRAAKKMFHLDCDRSVQETLNVVYRCVQGTHHPFRGAVEKRIIDAGRPPQISVFEVLFPEITLISRIVWSFECVQATRRLCMSEPDEVVPTGHVDDPAWQSMARWVLLHAENGDASEQRWAKRVLVESSLRFHAAPVNPRSAVKLWSSAEVLSWLDQFVQANYESTVVRPPAAPLPEQQKRSPERKLHRLG